MQVKYTFVEEKSTKWEENGSGDKKNHKVQRVCSAKLLATVHNENVLRPHHTVMYKRNLYSRRPNQIEFKWELARIEVLNGPKCSKKETNERVYRNGRRAGVYVYTFVRCVVDCRLIACSIQREEKENGVHMESCRDLRGKRRNEFNFLVLLFRIPS